MAKLVISSAPEKGRFFYSSRSAPEFDDRLAFIIEGFDAALLFWLLQIGVVDWCMGQPSCGAKVSALRCLAHVQNCWVWLRGSSAGLVRNHDDS